MCPGWLSDVPLKLLGSPGEVMGSRKLTPKLTLVNSISVVLVFTSPPLLCESEGQSEPASMRGQHGKSSLLTPAVLV